MVTILVVVDIVALDEVTGTKVGGCGCARAGTGTGLAGGSFAVVQMTNGFIGSSRVIVG